MAFSDLECVVFDVETTGLSPTEGDRIIEIAAIKIKGNKELGRFHRLVNPERSIPQDAIDVHKITNDMLKDASTAYQVLPEMVDFVGDAVMVGHNIKFDLKFLCFQLAKMGKALPEETATLDTLGMSRLLMPLLGTYRLVDVARHVELKIEETHRAMADVELTVGILKHLFGLAKAEGIRKNDDLFKRFGVPVPQFKLEQALQASLF